LGQRRKAAALSANSAFASTARGRCEPHHVIHRADGGRTSLTNLKGYCWWHPHVVLHELGWDLTVNPDGTSQVTSHAGKIIRSHHRPPPAPG
jgi:hypothetical protein